VDYKRITTRTKT